MSNHPSIYEINIRTFLKAFDSENKKGTLSDVPFSFWENLKVKGIDFVWLMGIWKTADSVIKKCCFQDDLVDSYKKALKDFKEEDVIGSPYAVDVYEVNESLSTKNELIEFKFKLNSLGIGLILDFVPNHFSSDSKLIKTHPFLFLQGDEENLQFDLHTFYKPENGNNKIFAHGRDPFFPAWTDTVQVNYFNKEARDFLLNEIISIMDLCDGLRCDMAMLPLNNIFNNTWLGIISKFNINKPETEFWADAIKVIKQKRKDFILIAEAYWDLEWNLQQLGFNFTYDKKLTDSLLKNNPFEVYHHLMAEKDYQIKSVRFIENHDEHRAVTQYGKDKSLAAAVIISTIQGMRFYHHGQFEGKKIKLPVQLRREPKEATQKDVNKFYNKLMNITNNKILDFGTWELLHPFEAWEGNNSCYNILCWIWKHEDKNMIVAVNYSESIAHCKVKFNLEKKGEVVFHDLLHNSKYKRYSEEISNFGLYIELKGYQSHIFNVE
jgi:1,4-alpha-glucan branching enzyme